MNSEEILRKFTDQMRRRIIYPDMLREESGHVVRHIRPAPGHSLVLFSDLSNQNVDAEIKAQITQMTSRQLVFDWKAYSYDSPSNLLERLRQHGFQLDSGDSLMGLDLREVPADLSSPVAADVRKVDSGKLSEVVQVLEAVWGYNFSWVYERLGNHLTIPGYLSIYIAYQDNIPACVGWTYYANETEFASLWGGSTIPSLRGKGLYKAVLAARIQEAIQRGRNYLVIDAGSMSRPIVERHGFVHLAEIYDCEYPVSLSV